MMIDPGEDCRSDFDQLGTVRHALYNGRIDDAYDLSRWTPSALRRQLGVRPHELNRIEAYLARNGLSLTPDANHGTERMHLMLRQASVR
jgi:hypothetical protein